MKELSREQEITLAAFQDRQLVDEGKLDCRFAFLLVEATRHKPSPLDLLPEVRFPLVHLADGLATDVRNKEILPDIILMALIVGVMVGQKYKRPITKGGKE